MRKLVIVNGPNNNFYGIRNKGQYGNQLYADLIQELKDISNLILNISYTHLLSNS